MDATRVQPAPQAWLNPWISREIAYLDAQAGFSI